MANRRRKDPLQWMDSKVERITKLSKLLTDSVELVYEKNYWSALKVISLGYLLTVYTTIMNNHREKFSNWYYIDIFAGCGVNKIKNENYKFLGSAFIPLLLEKNQFNQIILFEKDQQFYDALQKRALILKGDPSLLYPDNGIIINKEFTDYSANYIMNLLKTPKTHAFMFIDPEGIKEVPYELMKKLISLRIDILFLFNDIGIIRNPHNEIAVNRFFGNSNWQDINNYDDYVEIYLQNILTIFPNRKGNYVKIVGPINNQYHYYLLYLTNKTKTDARWMNAFNDLKNRIENYRGDICKASFDHLIGNKPRLTDYISK